MRTITILTSVVAALGNEFADNQPLLQTGDVNTSQTQPKKSVRVVRIPLAKKQGLDPFESMLNGFSLPSFSFLDNFVDRAQHDVSTWLDNLEVPKVHAEVSGASTDHNPVVVVHKIGGGFQQWDDVLDSACKLIDDWTSSIFGPENTTLEDLLGLNGEDLNGDAPQLSSRNHWFTLPGLTNMKPFEVTKMRNSENNDVAQLSNVTYNADADHGSSGFLIGAIIALIMAAILLIGMAIWCFIKRRGSRKGLEEFERISMGNPVEMNSVQCDWVAMHSRPVSEASVIV